MTEPLPGEQSPVPIKIFIADDHAMIRRGLTMILSCEPDFSVVGEAGDGATALALALELRPDVVLADITMPPPNGIELASQLRDALPETHTVIVSMHEDLVTVGEAFTAGAAGYVIKRAAGDELIAAVRAVVAGDCYIDTLLQRKLTGAGG